jgi:methyl-accepting chemotaxis protein
MSIKQKIVITPILTIIAIVILLGLSKFNSDEYMGSVSKIYNLRVKTLEKVSDLNEKLSKTNLSVSNSIIMVMLGETEDKIATIVDKNKNILNVFEQNLNRLMNSNLSDSEKSILSSISSEYSVYKKLILEVMSHTMVLDSYTSAEVFQKAVVSYDNIKNKFDNLVALESKLTGDMYNQNVEIVDRDNILSLLVAIGLIIFVIAINAFITITLGKSLKDVLVELVDSTSGLNHTSKDIKNSSEELFSLASEQLNSIEKITYSINDTTSAIKNNSHNALEADTYSKDANESAKDGFKSIETLLDAMQDINSSSQEISNIIKTIDEIAFQTNLLALNAAVEAARAGEHGSGFAVVADEVRSLAGRSASAAKEITDIISSSVQQVQNGMEISNKSYDAFNNILQKIENMATLISQIADSSSEQTNGISHISNAVKDVENVTNLLVNNSEILSAMSDTLDEKSKTMDKSVDNISTMVNGK